MSEEENLNVETAEAATSSVLVLWLKPSWLRQSWLLTLALLCGGSLQQPASPLFRWASKQLGLLGQVPPGVLLASVGGAETRITSLCLLWTWSVVKTVEASFMRRWPAPCAELLHSCPQRWRTALKDGKSSKTYRKNKKARLTRKTKKPGLDAPARL